MGNQIDRDGQHFVVFQFAGGRAAPSSAPTVVLNRLDEVAPKSPPAKPTRPSERQSAALTLVPVEYGPVTPF